jgi:hypothetical protein
MDPIVWRPHLDFRPRMMPATDDHRVMDGGHLVDVDLLLLWLAELWGRSSQSAKCCKSMLLRRASDASPDGPRVVARWTNEIRSVETKRQQPVRSVP